MAPALPGEPWTHIFLILVPLDHSGKYFALYKELEIITGTLQAPRYRYIAGAKGTRVLPQKNGYGQTR